MFKINLIPEVQEQKQISGKRSALIITISIAALIITVVALMAIGGIMVTNKVVIAATDDKIDQTKKEMSQYAEFEKTVLALEKGLTEARKILDGTNNWTKLLPHLEAATPNDVTYGELSVASGTIEARLVGKNVDSLARYVNSFKAYTVLTAKGSGTAGETVTLESNGQTATTKVKLDGTYVVSVKATPNQNFTAKVTRGTTVADLAYDATTQAVTSSDTSVSGFVSKLFTTVQVDSYNKDGKVNFEAKLTYDGSLVW